MRLIALVLLALALFTSAWAVPYVKAQDEGKTYVATSNGDKVIGSLSWEIVEVATHKLIGQGKKEVHLKDVEIYSDMGMVRKKIHLSDDFLLEMGGVPQDLIHSASDFTAFAMDADQAEGAGISEEPFTIDDATHATQNNGGGKLEVKMGKTQVGWEILKTKFLSDVYYAVVGEGGDADHPTWKVRILKNSTVDWPTLENGAVVSK